MKMHHIGYVTGSISETVKVFEVLGYVRGQVYDDTIQKCFICFLCRDENEPMIELVQPYEDNRSMQKMLAKKGVSPYHICYEVEDVQGIYNQFLDIEGWIPIFAPVEAVAFGNRKITYFMNSDAGFVEFVNQK